MITVVARPYDDEDIVEVYMAEHDSIINNSETVFEKSWNENLEAAKKKNPETWSVNEVIDRMEDRGWQIIHCNTVNVTY